MGKIPGVKQGAALVGKGLSKVVDVARTIEPVAKVAEKFDPYFRNPELGKLVTAAEDRINTSVNQVYKTISNAAKGLSPAEQARVGQVLEGGVSTGKYSAIAKPIAELAEKVGQEAVDLGLLSKESFQKYKGQYMTHIWNDVQKGGGLFSTGGVVPKIAGDFYKQRKGAEGFVKEFAPAMFKGLGTESKNNEIAKMYMGIADKFGVAASDYAKVPNQDLVLAKDAIANSKTARFFGDKLIPKTVADTINKTIESKNDPNALDKLYGLWKKGKTIWNPAYHVRNLPSNQILSDMSTGEGLLGTTLGYGQAVREYAGKGDQKFKQAAEEAGLIGRKNFGEMSGNLMEEAGYKTPQTGNKVVNAVKNVAKGFDSGATKLQNASEETSKLNVFTSWMHKLASEAKVTVDEALKTPEMVKQAVDKAQEAIFSPYRISKGERSLASKVVPFYSFARQAAPFTAKTLANNPERLTKYGKFKTAVESLTPDSTAQNPDVPGAIRTPIKDAKGSTGSIG